MSRIVRALSQLLTPDEPAANMAETTVTSPRAGGNLGPYQNVNRDKPMEATVAPPGARQQWQLWRVRVASRDLDLRSPIWGGYVRFVRIQCLGFDPARIQFGRLTKDQQARLPEVIRHLRSEWSRFQTIRGVGGTGQTIHQMAGSVLHHVDVDGDCFLTPRGGPGRRVWDLHPGDALAEGQFRTGFGGHGRQGNRQLGVETDGYGLPINYYFRHGGRLAPLNVEYSTFGGQGGNAVAIPAARVQHIRDMSGEVTAVRGWPRCTQVIEDIARLDEWYSALVRSATLRASIGILLEKDMMLGAAELLGAGQTMGDIAARSIGATQGETDLGREDVRPYQEFEANAGSITELIPGYKPHPVPPGAPTAQEATAIGMLERRVCAALRTTPATLLGDYKSLSFSGGQLGHLQERQAIEDRQMILAMQFYGPIYKDWLSSRWLDLMLMFRELQPADMDALLYPTFRLRKYQILDRSKIINMIKESYNLGLMTWSEARDELGLVSDNADEIAEEWKADRERFGLPETGGDESSQNAAGRDDDEDDEDDESDDKEEDDDDDDA